ncbi:MAG: RibD family protein [Bacteroidales bacterium]|nr:RibD family protein [Bacteroidales bacterium]
MPVRISNHQTEILNHKWRSEEDAILVGYNTALRDNPSLTNRLWAGKNPLRVVLDRDGLLPKNLKIFDDSARTVVLDFHGDDMPQNVLTALNEMKVQSLIIEGGASTHRRFIRAGLWDEARIFVTDVMLGGGTKAAEIRGGRLVDTEDVGGDRLLRYVRV